MLGFSVETIIIIGNTDSAGTVVLIGIPIGTIGFPVSFVSFIYFLFCFIYFFLCFVFFPFCCVVISFDAFFSGFAISFICLI